MGGSDDNDAAVCAPLPDADRLMSEVELGVADQPGVEEGDTTSGLDLTSGFDAPSSIDPTSGLDNGDCRWLLEQIKTDHCYASLVGDLDLAKDLSSQRRL
jgi:hypothetical protein